MFSGAALLAVASFYLLSGLVAIFTFPMGGIVLVFGLLSSASAGVIDDIEKVSPAKILVDRAVLGASIYLLAFLDTRLVLKRLVSSKTTIFFVLILALVGLFVDGLIGILAGGAGGYAVQEYTTQRNRSRILRGKQTTILAPGDLELPYEGLKQVSLYKNRLLLTTSGGVVRIRLPRGYSQKMSSKLEKVLPGKYVSSDSVDSAKASSEQSK